MRKIWQLVIIATLMSSLATTAIAQQGENKVHPPAQASVFTPEVRKSVLTDVADVLMNRAFVPGIDFTKWPEFIATRQEAVDAAENENAFATVVNQALREFGISHIRLLNPRAAAARGRTTTIGAGAFGVVEEGKGIRVRRVAEGSPAAVAGIKEGDLIGKVNGLVPTSTEILSGEKGVKLELEVTTGEETPKSVSLTLAEYSTVRKETLTWVDEETAVLKIFTFSAGYGTKNIEEKIVEASKKAKYLILDLRGNGGGATNNLNHTLSLLMPPQTPYGSFVNRQLVANFIKENPGKDATPESVNAWNLQKVATRKRQIPHFTGKIAVMINRGSASASEICAQALREGVGAKVIGGKSAGAVLASTFRQISGKFSIQYPVSDYVSNNGVRLEKNPVTPDVEAATGAGPEDAILKAAVEAIKASGK
jgi:carboxyl-terminal processing protease